MKIFGATACLFLLAFAAFLQAAETGKVAFVEFQNKAGTIITTNRWTIAEDLGKRLRKKNKNIQVVSRKEMLRHLKDLTWNEERLDHTQEGKLADIGARYVVYGSIVHWRVQGVYSNTEVQDASEANVIFKIDVVDLASGNSIKSFTVDGSGTGETGFIYEGDPSSFTDDNESQQMYDATEVALIKAADILSEVFAK